MNGEGLLSLDQKISNTVFVPLTDLYMFVALITGPHTQKLINRYWSKSDFKKYLCKVYMFTKGKKIVNPIFEDSRSQANLVFLIRYLCFIAFLFLYVAYFIFEWKINFIKGLRDLGESGLPLE